MLSNRLARISFRNSAYKIKMSFPNVPRWPNFELNYAYVVDSEVMAWLVEPSLANSIRERDANHDEYQKLGKVLQRLQSYGLHYNELKRVRLNYLVPRTCKPFLFCACIAHLRSRNFCIDRCIQMKRWTLESKNFDELQDPKHYNDAVLSVQNAFAACNLAVYLIPELQKLGLDSYMQRTELPLASLLADIHRRGFALDENELLSQMEFLQQELHELQERYEILDVFAFTRCEPYNRNALRCLIPVVRAEFDIRRQSNSNGEQYSTWRAIPMLKPCSMTKRMASDCNLHHKAVH